MPTRSDQCQVDLFDHVPGRKTRAPRALNHAQRRRLERWAEEKVPWISRGAFECPQTLDGYVEVALGHFRANGKPMLDWVEVIQNWIRREERGRLERMARGGASRRAMQALRDPIGWATSFDRQERTGRALAAAPAAEGELMGQGGGTRGAITRRGA